MIEKDQETIKKLMEENARIKEEKVQLQNLLEIQAARKNPEDFGHVDMSSD